MALTAQNIIDRSSMIVQDITNVRWPATELLNWLNDCRRSIASMRPDIYSVSTSLSLTAGAQQQLPADGVRLMDIPRNISGAAITVTQRGFLDQQNPSWHQMTQTSSILHFMLDERYPSNFWVYPPSNGSSQIEIIYQQSPTELSASSALNVFENAYAGAMVDYVCYRAFSKDSEYAGNADRAGMHYKLFQDALNMGAQTTLAASPNKVNIAAGGHGRAGG